MTLGGAIAILLGIFFCLVMIENDNKTYKNSDKLDK